MVMATSCEVMKCYVLVEMMVPRDNIKAITAPPKVIKDIETKQAKVSVPSFIVLNELPYHCVMCCRKDLLNLHHPKLPR